MQYKLYIHISAQHKVRVLPEDLEAYTNRLKELMEKQLKDISPPLKGVNITIKEA